MKSPTHLGAVAFARNGRLPDDLQQRSIIIEMQRRLPGEPLTELRERPNPSLERIAQQCARWADDNAEEVIGCDPDMDGGINRDADNWRPLYAVADVIGSDWLPDGCPRLLARRAARVRESSLKKFPGVPVEDADGCATTIVLGRQPARRAGESFSLVWRADMTRSWSGWLITKYNSELAIVIKDVLCAIASYRVAR